MFHSNTERLIEYWRARKVGVESPARSSIDPTDFTDILAQTFILGRSTAGYYPFRLAGGVITKLHARDLRRVNFLSIWTVDDQARLGAMIEAARRAGEPLVLSAAARTAEGLSLPMEVLLAPLRADHLPPERYLGLYQPLALLSELRDQPVTGLTLTRGASATRRIEQPRLRLAAVDGRVTTPFGHRDGEGYRA